MEVPATATEAAAAIGTAIATATIEAGGRTATEADIIDRAPDHPHETIEAAGAIGTAAATATATVPAETAWMSLAARHPTATTAAAAATTTTTTAVAAAAAANPNCTASTTAA